MDTPELNTALAFRNVDILFHRTNASGAIAEAIRRLDAGGTREEIASELGVTVGVAGATLEVQRGEISVLMGLSGSGKSTLLRAANRLNRVTRGSVEIGNGAAHVDIANCDDDTLREMRRTRVAMVFQQFGLLPWRTVRENVAFGLELRGMTPTARRKVADEKLELVGLSRWADSYVSELSGGMQQRVGLARAFATDADILLMDEPFSALDPLIRRKLQDELLDLQKRLKKTIVFVSHDIDEAFRIGSHIAIMREGRIIQIGAPKDIVSAPVNDYVRDFVRHMNPLPLLTAASVMRPLDMCGRTADGNIVLDERGLYVLNPATGVVSRSDGLEVAMEQVEGDDLAGLALRSGHICCTSSSVTLNTVAVLRQRSNTPVLIADSGQIVGLCDDADMLGAITGTPRSA
ncbi:proline/glycine betaine ABC transporter ATP-binding protein [Acetobacter estunensis NRIC 0472]|uniref:Trimethylamine N-oxide transport system ATP-binding protein TmoW n=1 Tax=Acetobacter estunensis TaxID=104097 RepID=A0A967B8P4_9PROT|nr:choline ABC transporter ATP-binding protein [Acetobacter estunensis]NHO54091.1 choline ABC transporter ATP-binding protein [Acetobacter estunensis]GBQ20897.1 proline/glycine betaine ABC transporter ATP-binding protein [Acetobacter estunensis NRIC 0472]